MGKKKQKLNILPSGQIVDVDEGVVEGSVDVGNTEDLLAFANLGAEGHLDLLNLLLLSFEGGHFRDLLFKIYFWKKIICCLSAQNFGRPAMICFNGMTSRVFKLIQYSIQYSIRIQ
jgi:hypothetical protein